MSAAAAFGAWLLEQRSRDDAIGELARTAAADRAFPAAADSEVAFDWAWEAGIEDRLLEGALVSAGAEHAAAVRG